MPFSSFSIVSEAIVGTAPTIFTASTPDNLATILTPGYLSYLGEQIKSNDVIYVNYNDTSVFPLNPSPSQLIAVPGAGLFASFGEFQVIINHGVPVLYPLSVPQGADVFPLQATFIITAAQLAAAGSVTLIAGGGGTNQFRILGMSNTGVPPSINFTGGGGNRNGAVTDGTTVYTVIPAGVAPPPGTPGMQDLINAAWGSAEMPFPAGASVLTPTAAGANVIFHYSGGSADYTAGQIVFSIYYIQVA